MLNKKVSVIIMTLNAQKYISSLLNALLTQTILPDEIIVADSESDDNTVKIAQKFSRTKIITVKRHKFDHGSSRDYALRQSVGDYVLFFTQDVIIKQKNYIEIMLKNFDDSCVAMAYARQVAKSEAYEYEKLIRQFNYPKLRCVKTKNSVKKMGIKAYYMSDCCSIYNRELYLKLGGFEHHVLISEDMLIAANAINAGYKVVYEANAYVYHSHNYTLKQEFERNRLIAQFMTMHQDIFKNISVDNEGIKLVKYVSKEMLKNFHFCGWIRFILVCAAKFLGNRYGKKQMNKHKKELNKRI